MTKDIAQEELWKRRFILAAFAQSNDVASTKSFAESLGIEFDKMKVLSDVESLFGIDTANTLRGWWDEVRQEEFDKKLERMLLLKAKELREEEPKANDLAQQGTFEPTNMAADFARDSFLTVRRTIRELLNPFDPTQWSSQGQALMGATRGSADKGSAADSASSPEIDPSLSIEEDSIVIWLRLSAVDLAFPKSSDAISLVIDGEVFSYFAFHRESDDTIAIEAKVGNMLIADLTEGNLTVTYKSDMSEVSIYMFRK